MVKVKLPTQEFIDQLTKPLSDETKVGDTPWKELKSIAMAVGYKESNWFQELSTLEKRLV